MAQMAIQPAERVLDVGCGTGAAMRFAAHSVGPEGSVHGVDVSGAMLECARATLAETGATIELRTGDALELPIGGGAYDVVLCAQTLQFLPNRSGAIEEMRRALRRGGRVGVSTWAAIEGSPYFRSVVGAIERHIGSEAARGVGDGFGLSSPEVLRALLAGGGFESAEVDEIAFELLLPEPAEFVPRHLAATSAAPAWAEAPEEARRAVVATVGLELEGYLAHGALRIPFRTLVGRGRKPGGGREADEAYRAAMISGPGAEA